MDYVNYFDGEVRIRKSEREDVLYLKDNLRNEDLKELELMGVEDIENSILFGYESPESVCYTMEFKGKIIAMFGTVPLEDDKTQATIWMLSTDEVKKCKKKFWKLAKVYVEQFKVKYETLFNLIHPSNTMSMKLVSLLKAELRWGDNGEFNSPKTGEPFVLFLI